MVPYTIPITNKKGNKIKNSIASLEEIRINGHDHGVLIRAKNIKNPLLIFLHGGPGCSEMALLRHYNSKLEDRFIVVNFDQRGTCKSYNSKIVDKKMNAKQIVEDTYRLIKIMKKRFNKKKVYVVGHSWGTLIGTLLAKKYPREINAYVGVSQVVHMKLAEDIAFYFILGRAYKNKNFTAIKELDSVRNITPHQGDKYLKRVEIERKWVQYFGGSLRKEKNLDKFRRIVIKSPEYKVIDVINYVVSSRFSLKKLWKELREVDFLKNPMKLKVPVYLIQGKHDYQTPSILVKEYFRKLKAPKKELIMFNKSAHSPLYEESEKFNKLIISKLLRK